MVCLHGVAFFFSYQNNPVTLIQRQKILLKQDVLANIYFVSSASYIFYSQHPYVNPGLVCISFLKHYSIQRELRICLCPLSFVKRASELPSPVYQVCCKFIATHTVGFILLKSWYLGFSPHSTVLVSSLVSSTSCAVFATPLCRCSPKVIDTLYIQVSLTPFLLASL